MHDSSQSSCEQPESGGPQADVQPAAPREPETIAWADLMDRLQIGIVIHSADTRILYSNQMARQLLGLDGQAMQGRSADDEEWYFLDEQGQLLTLEQYPVNRVLASGKGFRGMTAGICRPASGDCVWVSVDAVPDFDSAGQIRQVVVNFQDITHRKHSEELLRRYKTLLDQTGKVARIGGWEFDPNTGRLHCTEETNRILDLPVYTVMALDKAMSFYSPAVRHIVAEVIHQAVTNNISYDIEVPMVTQRGRQIWTQSIGQPEFSNGRCTRLHGTFQDITQRKKAQYESGLRLLELRCLYHINELADVPDLPAVELFRLALDRLRNSMRRAEKICARLWFDSHACQIGPSGRGEQEISDTIYVGPQVRGKIVLRYVRPENDSEDDPGFVPEEEALLSTICRRLGQIIERKEAQSELAVYRQSLEQQIEDRTRELREVLSKFEEATLENQINARHKDRFLSMMSHELRTPLNSLLGAADLLTSPAFGTLDEKQLEHVQLINSSGEHLLSMINDLLDIAKLDAGAMDIRCTDFAPKELLDATMAMMAAAFETKAISASLEIDPAVTSIHGDLRRCKQVLLNLLDNAAKYTPEGGRVVVRALPGEDDDIRIEVEDTGMGIAPGDQQDIFNEFHNIEKPDMENLRSTGLGLALVRRLVRQHGGNVSVRSEPGLGSTFAFTLPQHDRAPADQAEPLHARPPEGFAPPSQQYRVLLGENDSAQLAVVLKAIHEMGHAAIVGTNGPSLRELAEAFDPDLILMDLDCPQVQCIETTQSLRASQALGDIPVYAMIETPLPEAIESFRAAGGVGFITKPVREPDLARLLNALSART
jgi:PAS domain S-box-containing protein